MCPGVSQPDSTQVPTVLNDAPDRLPITITTRVTVPITNGDHLAEISREARQQLSAIQCYTETMEEEIAQQLPDLLSDLANIREAGKRLAELVATLEEEVAHVRILASVDPLTGIPNRRAFFERGVHLFAEAEPVSLIMLDIDRFKRINDHYGHLVGDEVLAAVAERFQRAIRDHDMLARLAGDEFITLLPGATYDVAIDVAARLREKVAKQPVHTSGGLVSVTVSLGVAERGDATPELRDLVEAADISMYKAKRTGRNRVAETLPWRRSPQCPSSVTHARNGSGPPVVIPKAKIDPIQKDIVC